MNAFDKACAVLAFALGVVFLILGGFGLFFGCNAHFTLPAVLGGLPALVGWGVVRSVMIAWKVKKSGVPQVRGFPATPVSPARPPDEPPPL